MLIAELYHLISNFFKVIENIYQVKYLAKFSSKNFKSQYLKLTLVEGLIAKSVIDYLGLIDLYSGVRDLR